MPIEIMTDEAASTEEVNVERLLFTESGELTAKGEVISAFIESVDFTDLISDPDIYDDFVEREIVRGSTDEDGNFTSDAAGDEHLVETIDGAVVAMLMDGQDMASMFSFWAMNEMPTDTLECRVLQKIAFDIIGIDEDDIELDERFKKGAFRKIRKTSGGPAIVNLMLGAMLNKEAIKRATKGAGKGYRKGDYDKDPSGYGAGRGPALKKYKVMSKKAKSGAGKAAQTAAKKSKGKLAAFAVGATKIAKKKAGKLKKQFAAAKKKALTLKSKKKSKSIAASDTSVDTTANQMYEGANMAGQMTAMMTERTSIPN